MRISMNLEKPESLRVKREGKGLRIYFDFEAAPTEDCPQAYTAYCVKVNGFNYSDIVAGIVKDRYPYDKMEAVLMNYLNTDSEKREQYISEYNEMQEWRAKAKEIAKQVSFNQ